MKPLISYYTKYLKLNLYMMCKYMNDVFKVMKRVYLAPVIKSSFLTTSSVFRGVCVSAAPCCCCFIGVPNGVP